MSTQSSLLVSKVRSFLFPKPGTNFGHHSNGPDLGPEAQVSAVASATFELDEVLNACSSEHLTLG